MDLRNGWTRPPVSHLLIARIQTARKVQTVAERPTSNRCGWQPPGSRWMVILTTVGATIIFQQAPITTQQPQSRQTISAIGLSEVRDSDAIITRQLRTGELRAYRSRQNQFRPDLRSERLAQYHRGVPVYGADVSRQTTNGLTTAVFGILFNNIHLDTIPGL